MAQTVADGRVSEPPSAPYLGLVIEHYRRPRNLRALASPTHAHEGVNALCGDRLRVELEVSGGVLRDAAFQASACAIATAAASVLTEHVRGATLCEIAALGEEEIIAALGDGIPRARRGCATLALRLLRQALGMGT